MLNQQKRLDHMIQELKKQSFRITPQRLAVLRILAGSTDHPSVDRIYAQVKADFPTTSLATVYKTLVLLKEIGEVLEIGFSDGSNRYDGANPEPHPHLICTKCRKIIDTNLETLEHLTDELSRETGFEIQNHRLDFFGICPECQTKASLKG